MNEPTNNSSFPTKNLIIGAAAALAIGYGYYIYSGKNVSNDQQCKPIAQTNNLSADVSPAVNSPSVTTAFTAAQQQEIQNIVLGLLKDKAEIFMGALNEGMQKQQDKMRTELEQSAFSTRDRIIEKSITLGNPQPAARIVAFIDPMCPHCHDFFRLVNALLQKRQDAAIHFVTVPILGPNSVAVSKLMVAAAKQSPDRMKTFLLKFIDKVANIDRAKLLQLAKESGLDLDKLQKDEQSADIEKELMENNKLAEELKIPGVPTIFGVYKDKLSIIPPMDINGFNEQLDNIKKDNFGLDKNDKETKNESPASQHSVEASSKEPASIPAS